MKISESKEFWDYVRNKAQEFRHKKIKEVFAKENPSDLELSILKGWAKTFGRNI